nr:hypothetical protein [Micromonospora sp. DSM 115978]
SDPFRGEVVKAVLVLAPGTDLTVEQVQAFAAEQLAPYKIPQVVDFCTESLPTAGPYGKPLPPLP